MWLAVPIRLKLEICVTGTFHRTEPLAPSIKWPRGSFYKMVPYWAF